MPTFQVPDDPDGVRRLVSTFAKVDLLIPPFVPLAMVSSFALALEQAKPEDRPVVATTILAIVYNSKMLAAKLLHRYHEILIIKDFSAQIGEAIEVFFAGYRYAAITALIPVIEGVIRKIANLNARDVGSGTKHLATELEHLIEREEASPGRFEERVVMLESLRDFVRDRLLRSTKDYTGQHQFNRHGILHGIFDGYDDPLNFYRAIILLELLCFFMSYFDSVSVFSPDDSLESLKLAERYMLLHANARG